MAHMEPGTAAAAANTALPAFAVAVVNPSGTLPAPENLLFQAFIDSLSYLRREEVDLVRVAYRFSEAAHQGQTRLSGEPYVTHPLAVASAMAEWRMDVQTVIAALLHDVMEDTAVGKAEIASAFGKPVAELVDGLSKLDKI